MIDFYEKQENINKLQSDLNVDTKKLIDVISKQVDDLQKQLHKLINSLEQKEIIEWVIYI